MRDLALLIHPLASIAFLLLAKAGSVVWTAGAQAYRDEMAYHTEKPKREHLLTTDGERLDVIVADETENAHERLLR